MSRVPAGWISLLEDTLMIEETLMFDDTLFVPSRPHLEVELPGWLVAGHQPRRHLCGSVQRRG